VNDEKSKSLPLTRRELAGPEEKRKMKKRRIKRRATSNIIGIRMN
jgi:hypothetical protein